MASAAVDQAGAIGLGWKLMRALVMVLPWLVAVAATTPGDAGDKNELFDAARTGDLARIKKLLEDGVYVDGADDEPGGKGETPLLAAVSKGQAAAVELLLDNGADQTRVNQDREAALHLAAKGGRNDIIKVLLAHGGDVNMATKREGDYLYGLTPLHLAVVEHPATVNLLVQCGANLNARDGQGNTPLHRAVEKFASSAVLQLLDLGANPTVRNKADQLPLQRIGEDCISKEAALALIANGFTLKPDLDLAMFRAIKHQRTLACVEFVEALLDQGADVNARSTATNGFRTTGMTPLMYAVSAWDVPMIAVLLGRGADPYIKDKRGWDCFDYRPPPEIRAMLETVPRPE
jgi:ankyrin repeat protein